MIWILEIRHCEGQIVTYWLLGWFCQVHLASLPSSKKL